ncbi:PQQ-dependent sugar dehydrogenase [Flavobacterium terrisoli]|uniref:PQQ-dependent sugar dehydrogenase n=1 Tax=Flavobacterium terrisoli TaxID=3242195 RepID=UPI0025437072|nr:PQQ-dependent sugar dehydrogenase [Flavobacterium buctense]
MKRILPFVFGLLTTCAFAQTIGLQSFATGFTSPVEIAHPANDARLFVVQQGGLIRIVNANGTVNATPFLTLTTATISTGGERGLLGLAFHPNYATNGYFYVNYTRAGDGATVIARYTVSTDPNIANAASASILLTISQPFSNHNGGSIKFGPDGYLYIGMGDGGSGGDPGNRAQNINENLGKMLRIDVDSASPYASPSTNPYVGIAGNDEIWAIGMRNPWKFSFNRLNGDLWIADVGQNAIEEVNKTAWPLPNTALNFGWRCYEGNVAYDNSGSCPTYANTVAPISVYTHGATGRCSVTGGYFYTGSTYPNFANKYFFADYCTAEIGWINNAGTITWNYDASGVITTFGEDKDGELYVANSGTIYKLIDTSLGTDSFSQNGLRMYPNPANNELFIKSENNIVLSSLKIIDLTGKIILLQNLNDAETNMVNVSGIAKGMYLVEIGSQSGKYFQSKLVVE